LIVVYGTPRNRVNPETGKADRQATPAPLPRLIPAGQLAQAHRKQDELAGSPEPGAGKPASAAAEWPLRGESLSHVDQLRTGLRVDDRGQ
jgi:hypothetical protein